MKAFLLTCCAALCAQGAFAFEWPSSGTATIPAGETAAITDADIANVANLDAIVLSDADSAVTANALSSALTLKANVSGPGTLTFTDCAAGLTLTGNNHLLTGNFAFDNSTVTVASRYGLGSNDTAMAVFTVGSASAFNFTGEGLTNNAPIKILGTDLTLPSNDTGETFVQNNNLYYDLGAAGKTLNFRRLYMTTGTFYQCGHRSYHYLNAYGGTTRFGKDAVVDINLGYIDGGGTFQFDARPKNLSITQFQVDIALGADDVFSSTFGWSRQLNDNEYGLELMGHDQTLKSLDLGWRTQNPLVEGEARHFSIKSATPATLRLTGVPGGPIPYRFTGQASFDFNGSGEIQLVNVTSDTTGGMTVSSGTLTMKWSFGWNGTNALVKSGATWNINTPNVLTTGKARLVIEAGGTLNGYANNVTVASANIGGVELPKDDVYSPSRLNEISPGVWTGAGSLIVVPEEESEFEWPTTPGATAKIPMGKTVTVTDADLPKIAILGGIEVRGLATLAIGDLSEPYDLTVPISGYGTVSVTNCPTFAIVANNTNFFGHFEFENTDVIVSNRFALGNAMSSPAHFTKGSGSPHIRFLGGGLTNDVALTLHGSLGEIPYGTDETLYQNADITFENGTAWSASFSCRNLTLTHGLLQCTANKACGFSVAKKCSLTLGEDSNLVGTYMSCNGNSPSWYVIATTNVLRASTFAIQEYAAGIRFEASGFFTGKAIDAGLSGSATGGYDVNLNGYDQSCDYLGVDIYHYTPVRGKADKLRVKSAKPATLTMTASRSIWHGPLIFSDFAGLTFAGTYYSTGDSWGRFEIYNHCSETKGTLAVTSGTLAFKWDAGWFGTNVVVSGTGTLEIQETARSDFFTPDNATERSVARVTVTDSGTIDLGADIAAHVGYLSTNGVELVKGTYGGADAGLDAAHTLSCLTGTGTLTVQRGKRRGFVLMLK